MSKRGYIRVWLFGVCLSFFSGAFAQFDFPNSPSDSILYHDCNRWEAAARAAKWDSAIYYGNHIASVVKKEFGEMSHGYAVAAGYYLGYLYAVVGEYQQAHDFLKRAIDIFSSLNDTAYFRYKYSVFYYGIVCYSIGAYTEAEPYLLKAAEFCKQLKDIPEYAQALINVAAIHVFKGEYAKAESLDLQMKEVLDTMPNAGLVHYLIGTVYNNLSVIYSQTGNPQKALQYMQKSEAIEKIPSSGVTGNDYLIVVLNLADAFANCNQLDSALNRCRQAEDSLANDKTNYLFAKLLKEKANIYQQKNNLTAAINLYEQYKTITDSFSIKPDEYDATILNLGALYTATKQYTRADSLFREEIQQMRQRGFEYSFELQQSLAGLCANLIGMKKYGEASDSLLKLCRITFRAMSKNFIGMSEADQLHYRTVLDGFFDLLYTCIHLDKLLNRELIAETFRLELQRKNLILTNQIRLLDNARNSSDSGLITIYNDWLNNRQMLSKQYSLPVGQRFFNTDSLEYLSEKFEKQVSAKSMTTFFADNNVPLAKLFENGDRFSGNIEFVRYKYRTENDDGMAMYAAFVFKQGDTLPAFVHLCSEDALMKLMKNKKGEWIDNDQLTQKIYNSKNAGSKSLYQLIWQPLEPYLSDIKTVNYSPAGIFNNIALHAVHDGKNYLLNRYTLHRYTNLREAGDDKKINKRPEEINIWGNMNYDEGAYAANTISGSTNSFAAPGMKTTAKEKSISKSPLQSFDTAEISSIKKIFYQHNMHVVDFENNYATEENFKEQAANIKGVLHISTHGFYAPLTEQKKLPHAFLNDATISPLFRCGLAFSGVNYYWIKGVPKSNHEDGILTGYEVAQLDLHNVQLVTLSACETGLGDVTGNEGNLGLERAFKLAGVHNLLVSLWEVPAKQTAELLSLFYDNWLQGKTPAEALRMAEHTMQQKKYPPFFWAGFVLVE